MSVEKSAEIKLPIVGEQSKSIEGRLRAAGLEIEGSKRRHASLLAQTMAPFIIGNDIPEVPVLVEGIGGIRYSEMRRYIVLDTDFDELNESSASTLLSPEGSILHALKEAEGYDLVSAKELEPEEYPVFVDSAYNGIQKFARDFLAYDFVDSSKVMADQEIGAVKLRIKEFLGDAFWEFREGSRNFEKEVSLKDEDGSLILGKAPFVEIIAEYEAKKSGKPGLLLLEDGSLVWAYKMNNRYDLSNVSEISAESYPRRAREVFRGMLEDSKTLEVAEAVSNGEIIKFVEKMQGSESPLVKRVMKILLRDGKLYRAQRGKDNYLENDKAANLETALPDILYLQPEMFDKTRDYKWAVLSKQFSYSIDRGGKGGVLIEVKKPEETYSNEELHFNLHVIDYLLDGTQRISVINFTENGQIVCVSAEVGEESEKIEVFERDNRGKLVVNQVKQEEAVRKSWPILNAAEWLQRSRWPSTNFS